MILMVFLEAYDVDVDDDDDNDDRHFRPILSKHLLFFVPDFHNVRVP